MQLGFSNMYELYNKLPLGDYYYSNHISFVGIASIFIACIMAGTNSGISLKVF